MITEARIRPARPQDEPRLQEICRAVFAPAFKGFRAVVGERIAAVAFVHADAEQAQMLSDLCTPAATKTLLVVEHAGQIAGFVTYGIDTHTRMGEISLNAVDPAFAGRGLGSWMYSQALARMKAAGMEAASVSTGDDAAHAPARAAYRKAGFGPEIRSVSLYCAL